MQTNEIIQENKMTKVKMMFYWTIIISSAIFFTYLLTPKVSVPKRVCIERDSVKICLRNEVESKVCGLTITGHQIIDVDFSDNVYAKITYRDR